MFGRLGWMEILLIVVLLVILFGHKSIPGMMKNLANGINTFKHELKNTNMDVKSDGAKKVATVKKNRKTAPKAKGKTKIKK